MKLSEEERLWLLSTVKHSCHVEYYLCNLNMGNEDPERPHDIMGENNKFSLKVMKGLVSKHKPSIQHSIDLHRRQFHHQRWRNPNNSTRDNMLVGAVDALCSRLEGRDYQRNASSFHDLIPIIDSNEEPYRFWMYQAYTLMGSLRRPNLSLINSLDNIPNIGLPGKIHNDIISRLNETLKIFDNL